MAFFDIQMAIFRRVTLGANVTDICVCFIHTWHSLDLHLYVRHALQFTRNDYVQASTPRTYVSVGHQVRGLENLKGTSLPEARACWLEAEFSKYRIMYLNRNKYILATGWGNSICIQTISGWMIVCSSSGLFGVTCPCKRSNLHKSHKVF